LRNFVTAAARRWPISIGSTGNTGEQHQARQGGRAEQGAGSGSKRRGLRIMVGGAIGTSLGVAPALLVWSLRRSRKRTSRRRQMVCHVLNTQASGKAARAVIRGCRQ
jgi:hypothetical protein